MNSVQKEDLRNFLLFTRIEENTLEEIYSKLHRNVFPQKTNFINIGLPDDTIFIIAQGTVKVYIPHAEGKSVILAILGPGEIIGEINLIDNIGRSATAITQEDCLLFWMERGSFETFLMNSPQLSTNLALILARRLRLANAQIHSLAVQDVFGRVARQLLAFADVYGITRNTGEIEISVRLTQSDIAGMVGSTRKSVNEVIGYYKERRYITEKDCYYSILNKTALIQRAK